MIAVSMGDPNGVGPEIALKAFADNEFPEDGFIVGDISVLRHCSEAISIAVPLATMKDMMVPKGVLNVLDMGFPGAGAVRAGKKTAEAGAASLQYIKKAAQLAIDCEVEAMVTLPVCKEAIMSACPGFIGHTELIARMCGVDDYTMMLASESIIATHVSTHVSLKDAIAGVKCARILKVIELTADACRLLRRRPRIAVAGLNPHAGEGGVFGDEEIREIVPALEQAKGRGFDVTGPVPPDTVFFRAARGEFDAVVCMYHDQGHIAMKCSGLDDGVNVTLGLPIVRTSVDHGTAFDIAYTGKVSTGSFVNACRMAHALAGAEKSPQDASPDADKPHE
ncbi:MAG: 4-hydroxythreonine-4-phosphate dehydrogenase PdxA [Victivallales bacterium]|nr:4-hydroxythreonine-4-phosphate dehydrogenase PdxA [Victivallales bacterium]